MAYWDVCFGFPCMTILGDPGADSGGKGKSKRAGKCGTKMPYFPICMPYFPARLDFSSPPLSAPGSPRMMHDSLKSKMNQLPNCLGSIKNLDYSLLSIN